MSFSAGERSQPSPSRNGRTRKFQCFFPPYFVRPSQPDEPLRSLLPMCFRNAANALVAHTHYHDNPISSSISPSYHNPLFPSFVQRPALPFSTLPFAYFRCIASLVVPTTLQSPRTLLLFPPVHCLSEMVHLSVARFSLLSPHRRLVVPMSALRATRHKNLRYFSSSLPHFPRVLPTLSCYPC